MRKLNWVIFESLFGAFGLGHALFGFLEGYPAPTIALSFSFGIFMSLVVIGMAPAKT